MKKQGKIAIIGVGYVGASICYALMLKTLAREIVLIDSNPQKAKGEAMDIAHGIPYMGNSKVYTGDYADCCDCDMIIITAGRNRKPGQERTDLVDENTTILHQISLDIKKYYNGGVILVVSNPVDIMTYKVAQWMGLPNGMVFGTGCILDTSRLIRQLAEYVEISIDNIQATVIGEHGVRQCPIWSRVTVANIPIDEYCKTSGIEWDELVRQKILMNIQTMGAEIIKRKERTHYGISTCVAYLVDAVMNDRKIVASVSSVLQGEYGIYDVSLSVPSVIGKNGIEKHLTEKWEQNDIDFLINCSEQMKTFIK